MIWEPPSAIELPRSAKPTVPSEMIATLRVSGLTVTLEEAQLSTVQKRFGGTIGHRGDAADSLSWLCFHGIDVEGNWVLWLMSGEMDRATVGGFRWQRVDGQVDSRCQTLPDARNAIELPISLRLGTTTRAGVLSILGQPTTSVGDGLFYLHEHDKTIRYEPLTVMNTVDISLRDGVICAIEVWKSTIS